jgi:hypothetical protein
MKISVLKLSVAINVLLLVTATVLGIRMLSPSNLQGQSAAEEVAKHISSSAQATATATDVKRLYNQLTACGITAPNAKRLLAAPLPAATEGAYEYWRPTTIRQLSQQLAEYDARQLQRAALVKAFGKTAIDDDEFSKIFFPFAQRWSYLSRSQQATLEATLAHQQRNRLAAFRGRGIPIDSRAPVATTELERLISIDGAREYNIHESALAQSLSNIGFNFSEEEFRRVFIILSKATGGNAGAMAARLNPLRMGDEHDPITLQIKEALGADRFAEYQKSQDPKYRVLLAAGDLYGVSAANLETAYRVSADTAAKIALTVKQGPVLSVSASKEIGELRAYQEQKLRTLLGAEAFDFFMRSTATFAGTPPIRSFGLPVSVRTERED